MASYFLCPLTQQQFLSDAGAPLSGGTLSFYQAGTVTPQAIASTPAGGSPATSITLGPTGRPQQMIWQPAGVSVKIITKDASGNQQGITLDNIPGIDDSSLVSFSEWVPVTGTSFSYSSITQFSTSANTLSTFLPGGNAGRRIQATVTAGTVYGSVVSASGTGPTTVNVLMDPGTALDSGLSAVSIGFLGEANPSVPANLPYPFAFMGVANNSAAAAGYVGQIISNSAASVTGMANNTPFNITSISLTAGDWDAWGGAAASSTTNGLTSTISFGISTTTATMPTGPGTTAGAQGITGNTLGWSFAAAVPSQPISLNATTTIYLVGVQGTVGASNAANGAIYARRRR